MGPFRRVFSMMCIRAVGTQFVQRFLQAKHLDVFFFTLLNVCFCPRTLRFRSHPTQVCNDLGMTGSWSAITSLVLTA